MGATGAHLHCSGGRGYHWYAYCGPRPADSSSWRWPTCMHWPHTEAERLMVTVTARIACVSVLPQINFVCLQASLSIYSTEHSTPRAPMCVMGSTWAAKSKLWSARLHFLKCGYGSANTGKCVVLLGVLESSVCRRCVGLLSRRSRSAHVDLCSTATSTSRRRLFVAAILGCLALHT